MPSRPKMQAVLYTSQLEPITVVLLSGWIWDRLWAGEEMRLPVPVQPMYLAHDSRPVSVDFPVVRIRGEPLRRGQHSTLMLFTVDEEHALRLRADFLPGQRGTQQERERGAFAKGFLNALQKLGE